MARPEGMKKTGGRKAGTPNKRTIELIERLESSGMDVPARICFLISSGELSSKEQMESLLELLQYIYPKRKALEANIGPIEEVRQKFTLAYSRCGCAHGKTKIEVK